MPTRATDVAVGSDVRCWEPLHRALGTGPVSMVLRTAIVEDLATLEQIQPVLESGAKPYFLLQDNEIAIRHHHKMVDDFIQAGASRL
jgi:hypothetical protein